MIHFCPAEASLVLIAVFYARLWVLGHMADRKARKKP